MRNAKTRVIAGGVNGDGSVRFGADFIPRRTATGTYFISFPGCKCVSATISLIANIGAGRIDSVDGNQIGFSTWNQAFVYTDMPFTFVAVVTV